MSFKEKWKNFITHPYAAPLYEFGKATKKTRNRGGKFVYDNAGSFFLGVVGLGAVLGATFPLWIEAIGGVSTGVAPYWAIYVETGILGATVGLVTACVGGMEDFYLAKFVASVVTSPVNVVVGLVKGLKNTIKYKNDVDGYRKMINPPPPPTPAPAPSSQALQKSRVEKELDRILDLDGDEQTDLIKKLRETHKDMFNEIIKKEVDTRISIENIDKVKNDIPRKRLNIPHRKTGRKS